MLILNRTIIHNIAANDAAYSRGLQHFKNGDVRSASYSKLNRQYKLTVHDVFDYMVGVSEKEDGTFDYTCNCAAHVRESGACKHVVASLFRILKHQEKQEQKDIPPEERRPLKVLEYFSNQEDVLLGKEIFHIEPIITVGSILGGEDCAASLSIRVGSTRLYKVQSLKRFVADYLAHQNIVLGKDFRFIYDECEFDRASKEVLDFIINVYEIQELTDLHRSSKVFYKSSLSLTEHMLIRFLRLLGKNVFELCLYDRTYEKVKAFSANPNIRYDLDVIGDAIVLDYRDKDAVIPLSRSGELIYYNGAVFMPNQRFRQNYVPLFNVLGGDKGPLVFAGDNKQRFLEEVLPKLSDSMDIEVPEELKERYISFPLENIIYFDKYQNGIKADLHFKYGEYEFGCFENPKTDYYILVRQKEKEEEIMSLLDEIGFEARSTFFYMKNETSIYEFITSDRGKLEENAVLYYSEDFRKLKVRTGGSMHIDLRVSSTMDLLEMSFDMDGMSKSELKDLFRSLKVKKKYYRLEDGSFINLLDSDMQKLSTMMDNLGISASNIGEESIRLGKSSAFYLQDAFEGSGFSVERNDEFTKLIDNIALSSEREYELPTEVNATLRPYQETGYRWLRTLADNSLGGILADDMGLGKTLQAIVYMKAYAGDDRTFLVVCPSSIVYNWLDEVENFAPSLRVQVVTGTPEVRAELIAGYGDYDIIITSYPLMRRDISHYKKLVFHTVFLDEAQFIKNAASQNAMSVKLLQAEHRFALTGTPIENSLSELWSIFDFIMPNFLLSHSRFANKYEKPALKGDTEVLAELGKRIRPFILRRMKTEVLKDLPGKLEEKMITELTDEQKKVYLSYMNDIRTDLFGEISRVGIEKSQLKILAALTRLRQICCHPSTFIENYDGGSGKLDLLLDVLDSALESGHRILLFSQFTSMLEIIAKELEKKGIEFFYLEGTTPLKDRLEYVKQFNGGERSVFLISLKAGGTGLNLTGADTVIHYDPWWNPAVEDQATDRAYRIGQTSSVYVLKLLTRGTIEEKIYKLQQQKKLLSDSVIQSKEVFISKLTREELEDIFTFEG